MATAENPVQRVSDLLNNALEESRVILVQPEHNMILLGVETDLKRIINRLMHISGAAGITSSSKTEFEPITSFMGEELAPLVPVDTAGLDPDEALFQQLRNRVDRLYAELPTMSIEAILSAYTIPEDKFVLRGVAKLAGIEDFKEREIDADFVEDILEAIKAKQEEAERLQQENELLAKQDRIVKLEERITEVKQKREALIADVAQADTDLKANTDGRKKSKLEKALKDLQEEVAAAEELIANLLKELEDLHA